MTRRGIIPPPWALACALTMLAAGCSAVPGFLGGSSTERISIISDADANGQSATAVDLVMTTSDDVAASLLKFSARDWFQRKTQLLRDYPDDITVTSWELAPGQHVPETAITAPSDLKDSFVFADYVTLGDHRLRLGDARAAHIVLDKSDLRRTP